ncbi:M28 family peptidase [Persicobacter diffluens]|uniref:Peptidase M28 n=1 Tax=Persicobacter diffluens TaxID=981 RepID=A0AAN4VY35_9BACT|nr:peptidase M28 [Persicobacter diffluens]
MFQSIKAFAFLFLIFSCAFPSMAQFNPKNIDVNPVKLEGQMNFFASDELRGRDVGTPEIDIAAKWLAATMQSYGVQSPKTGTSGYFQEVLLYKKSAPTAKVSTEKWEARASLTFSANRISGQQEAIFLGYGSEKDFENTAIKGKVVITLAGNGESGDLRSNMGAMQQKKALAEQKGAIALVELYSGDAKDWDKLDHHYGSAKLQLESTAAEEFPVLWQQLDAGVVDMNPGTIFEIEMEVMLPEMTLVKSKNVIGIVEGTDAKLKNEFVLYTAHYDHIGVGLPNAEGDSIYNGARDNGSGVLAVLNAAEQMTKTPTKRSAAFLFLTAEEKGILGSKWYVEHPVIPLENSVFVLNNDSGGLNDPSTITVIGLHRTSAERHFVKAAKTFNLTAKKDPTNFGLFDRSDNVSFAQKGIPAPMLSLGFTGFDEEITKYYHQQADNPENMDYEYLNQYVKAFIYSGQLIGNDKKRPYWTSGDKYENAGNKLYGF